VATFREQDDDPSDSIKVASFLRVSKVT